MKVFTFCKSITYLEYTIIRQTDNITSPSLIDSSLSLSHELCRRRKTHCLTLTYMQIRSVARELARAHFAESHARTVVRIDVGCYLEDKTGKLLFIRRNCTFLSLYRTRTRCDFYKTVKKFLHTEVVECRTEEHRRQISVKIFLYVKIRINTFDKFQVISELLSQSASDMFIKFLRINVHLHLFSYNLLRRLEKIKIMLIDIVNTLETLSLVDWP